MNTLGQVKPPGSSKRQSHSANPFARALAESEKISSSPNPLANKDNDPFNDALAQAGGNIGGFDDARTRDAWQEQQRQELEQRQKREALRRKLHDQVNPVDQRDVFNAREKQVKEEIEKLRKELQLLAQDVAKFDKEVEMTLFSEVPSPGQDGKYYISFFQKLRAFIMLLRQKIKSASTWATQVQSKKSKKKKRGGALLFEGKGGHEKTKTIYDMMHHEVSNARSGG